MASVFSVGGLVPPRPPKYAHSGAFHGFGFFLWGDLSPHAPRNAPIRAHFMRGMACCLVAGLLSRRGFLWGDLSPHAPRNAPIRAHFMRGMAWSVVRFFSSPNAQNLHLQLGNPNPTKKDRHLQPRKQNPAKKIAVYSLETRIQPKKDRRLQPGKQNPAKKIAVYSLENKIQQKKAWEVGSGKGSTNTTPQGAHPHELRKGRAA